MVILQEPFSLLIKHFSNFNTCFQCQPRKGRYAMKLTLSKNSLHELKSGMKGKTSSNYFLQLKSKMFSNKDSLIILTCADNTHS